jgi:opacity protein-like surface antigen
MEAPLDVVPRRRGWLAIVGGGIPVVVVIAAIQILQPQIAAAESSADPDPFDRPGFYTGIGGSYQYNVFNSRIEDLIEDEVDDALPGANSTFDLDDSGGLNALAGYRLTSWFALELQYEWVNEYDIKGSTETPVAASGTLFSIEGHTLTANTKWIIPFWRIQPYFLLGGGVAISKVDNGTLANVLNALGGDIDDGTHAKAAARTGLGLDVYLTQHILINAQASAVLTTLREPDLDDIDDLNYMTFAAGLQYRF